MRIVIMETWTDTTDWSRSKIYVDIIDIDKDTTRTLDTIHIEHAPAGADGSYGWNFFGIN